MSSFSAVLFMCDYLKKIFTSTSISLFIVGIATSTSHQSVADGGAIKEYSQAISGAGETDHVFEFRTSLISWFASHATIHVLEIEENLRLNRNLERKKCHSRIIFSYLGSNKSLIRAECQGEWRRFVKRPPWLLIEQIEEIIADQEANELVEVQVVNKDVGEGEPIKSQDLDRKKLRGNNFSPFVPKLTEYSKIIASKDLRAGDPISQENILVGQQVLTAAIAIPSGSRLSETLTKFGIRYKNIPSDALKENSGWAFMETNRTIMAGDIIRERHLRKAKLVRRKDPVTMISTSSSIEIITSGIAMQDGYYGQSVKVKNTESGRNVVGTVIGRGKVEVNTGQ